MRTVLLNRRAAAVEALATTPSSLFNSKVADPSRLMHPSDGRRRRCAWIEHGLTIHSDGNVTCGLDDPHGRRSFGNINRQALSEIWANPEYARLQTSLWEGGRCTECNLAQEVDDPTLVQMPARAERPTTLVAETTVRCNLRCPQPACIPNNDKHTKIRDSDFLDASAFRRVADELAGELRHVFFYNYGDPFVHVGAEDMLTHLRQTSPAARVVSSTNGAPLAKMERARRLVAGGGLDFVVFTISGVTQESYARYHVGGRVELALRGMRNVLEAKRELGAKTPIVHWRYLLFNWNDSEAEVDEALKLARQYGVDEFSLYLTHIPREGASRRFAPGAPDFIHYRKHIENALGYTRVSPMPDADGFYGLEQTAFGPARWTSWQARRRLRVENGRARLALTTSRPGSRERVNHVFVLTPWRQFKVPLQPDVWRTVEFAVPNGFTDDRLEVCIVAQEPWFPIDEHPGSTDLRCLGALVLEGQAETAPIWRGHLPLTAGEAALLSAYRFQSPRPLVDW